MADQEAERIREEQEAVAVFEFERAKREKRLPSFAEPYLALTTNTKEPAPSDLTVEQMAENSGSEERQGLAQESSANVQKASWHPLDKLYGMAQGAYRAINPTDAEARKYAEQQRGFVVNTLPGETNERGEPVLSEKPPVIDTKTGKPKDRNAVLAGAIGAAKGLTLLPALINPPEGTPATEEARTEAKEDTHRRYEENHPIINAITDTADVLTALPKLIGEALLPDFVPAKATEEEAANASQQRGSAFGRSFAAGALGASSAALENLAQHPLEQAGARPATTLATVLPIGKALGKLGKAAAATELGKAASGVAAGLAEPVIGEVKEVAGRAYGTVYPARVMNYIQDAVEKADRAMNKLGVPKDLAFEAKKVLVDSFAHDNPQAAALIEQIARDPDEAASRIAFMVKRVANRVSDMAKTGDLDIVEQGPPPITKEYLTAAANKLEQNSRTLGSKISTLEADKTVVDADIRRSEKFPFDYTDAEVEALHDAHNRLVKKLRAGQKELHRQMLILQDAHDQVAQTAEDVPTHEPPVQVIGPFGQWPKVSEPVINETIAPTATLRRRASIAAIWNRADKHGDYISDAIHGIASELEHQEGYAIKPSFLKITDKLLSALDEESIALLKDEKFKQRVIDEAAKRITPSAREEGGVRYQLAEVLNTNTKDGVVTILENFQNGVKDHLPVSEVISDILKGMSKDQRSELVHRAMEATGSELANEAATEKLQEGIRSEQGRHFRRPTEEDIADNAERRIAQHELARQTHGPGAEGRLPSAEAEAYAEAVAYDVERGGLAPQIMPAGVLASDVAVRLRQRANELSARLQKALPDDAAAYRRKMDVLRRAAISIDNYQKLAPELRPKTWVEGDPEAFADPVVNKALSWHEKARQQLQDPKLAAINRLYKTNLTARNPTSVLNNFGSNIGLQMVSRGVDPLQLVGKALGYARDWMQYLAGVDQIETVADLEKVKANPVFGHNKRDIQMFHEALEQTNLLNTDLVVADYGRTQAAYDLGRVPVLKQLYKGVALKDTPLIGKWLERKAPAVSKAVLGLEPAYRVGDNLLKLEETASNYFDEALPYLRMLKSGQKLVLSQTSRRKVTIQRVGDKYRVVDPLRESTKNNLPLLTLDDPIIQKYLVEAAGKPAQDKFFDYGDTGLLAKWLRASPIMGTRSGFYSYVSKAVDIPFVKKGQLYRSLVDTGFDVETDNPEIMMHQAGKLLGLGARKAILVNGLTQELKAKSTQELGKVFRFMPDVDKSEMITVLSNPGYIASANFGSWNFGQASLKLFRFLADTYVAATRPKRSEVYPPKDTLDRSETAAIEEKQPKQMGHGADVKLEGYTPEQRNGILRRRNLLAMHDNGELWSGSEFLDLVGLAGDPVSDTLKWISQSKETGKVLTLGDTIKRYAASFLGVVPMSAVDVGVGAYTGGKPAKVGELGVAQMLTTRGKFVSPDPQLTVPFLSWVIRKFTGMGWQVKRISDATNPGKPNSYFNGLVKEWTASLQVPQQIAEAKKWIAAAKNAKGNPEINGGKPDPEMEESARELLKSALLNKSIIRREIRRQYINYKRLAEKVLGVKLATWQDDMDQAEKEAAAVLGKTAEQLDRENQEVIDRVLDGAPSAPIEPPVEAPTPQPE